MKLTRGDEELIIKLKDIELKGILNIPSEARGLVVFVHGSGSSRLSSRNQFVAQKLNKNKIGTFLFDLLTESEEIHDRHSGILRFDIELLSNRTSETIDFLKNNYLTSDLKIGLFGASTGAAAAIISANKKSDTVCCVVSRGGRVDMAGFGLKNFKLPILMIVGSYDNVVLDLNQKALQEMINANDKKLVVIPEAGHLFEEPHKLEEVASEASQFFDKYFS